MRMTTRRNRDEEGFALATCLMIVIAIFLLLAAILQPLSRDITTTRRFLSAANDRQLAESVLNELYTIQSRAVSVPRFTLPGRVDPSTSGTVKDVKKAGTFFGWGQFNATSGRYETCGSDSSKSPVIPNNNDTARLVGTSCYYYSVLQSATIVTVEVTTRSGCNAVGRNCVFKRYQQRWKRRSFLDYVIFTDQETLAPSLYPATEALSTWTITRTGGSHKVYKQWAEDHCADRKTQTTDFTAASKYEASYGPALTGTGDTHRRQMPITSATGLWSPFNSAGTLVDVRQPANYRHEDCFDIAYTENSGSGDVIDGPIKTNDPYLWYCGAPTFSQTVAADGPALVATPATNTGNYFRKSLQTGCATGTTGVPKNATAGDPVVQPQPYDAIPTDLGEYWKFAAIKIKSPTAGGPAVITLKGANLADITGETGILAPDQKLPPRSLIFVNGDLNLGSTGTAVTSGVTFMATGAITVTGNIVGPPTPASESGIMSSDVGLIARGAVKITKDVVTQVDASLMSLTEAVYVTNWDKCVAPETCGRAALNLTGAVIGRYRPVFGTYSGTGALMNGMRKNVRYPTHHKPNPPYFLTPVNATWERIDLTEIQFGKVKGGGPALVGLTAPPPLSGFATSQVDGACVSGGTVGSPIAEPVNLEAITKMPIEPAPAAAVASGVPSCLAS
jgi:type II secretory pathway pseudopilin PulG